MVYIGTHYNCFDVKLVHDFPSFYPFVFLQDENFRWKSMVHTYSFPDRYSEFKGYWEEKYSDNSVIFVNYLFIYL